MSAVLRLTEHDTLTGDGKYFSRASAFDYNSRFWLGSEVRGVKPTGASIRDIDWSRMLPGRDIELRFLS